MGGLGFFLYGMKLMSEGLQKVAGSKMRSILEGIYEEPCDRSSGRYFLYRADSVLQRYNRYGGQLRKLGLMKLGTGSWNYPRSKHRYDSYRTADRV